MTRDFSRFETFAANREHFARLLRSTELPPLCVIVQVKTGKETKLRFGYIGDMHQRIHLSMEHVEKIIVKYGQNRTKEKGEYFEFVFQADDRPADLDSASWERKSYYKNVTLVPDLYYTQEHGYHGFMEDTAINWSQRKDCVLWRGVTTGGFGLTINSINSIPRYKLCMEALLLREGADVGFNGVVQIANGAEEALIRAELNRLGLIKNFVNMEDYAKYKLVVQIDGNANSWGLLKKLRLGSCLLIVESEWRTVHSDLLRPWEHYVPVQADLSDFREKTLWCLANQEEAERIAGNGRRLALEIDYAKEMRSCADRIYETFARNQIPA